MRKTVVLVPILLAAAATSARADVRRFGVMLDAGVPDGANGSLVYRPYSFVRLHAGGGHNLIAPGMRMGIDLLPFGQGLSASVDAGHYFRGDANRLARMVSGDDDMDVRALRNVGYDYANFHVGLEWGHKYATFYLHGGMSYVRGVAKDPGRNPIDPYTDVTFKGDPKVTVWAPSVKLGLIVYLAK